MALATLDMLADRGWRAISGDAPEDGLRSIGGNDAVADRTEIFDPFEALLGRVD